MKKFLIEDELQEVLLCDMPAKTEVEFKQYSQNHSRIRIQDSVKSFGYEFNLGVDGFCKFDSAEVKFRGTNLSAIVWRNMMEVLPQLGVQTVNVHANQIGSYLWSRVGFSPFPGEWARLAPQLERRLDYLVSVNGENVQNAAPVLRQHLRHHDPKSLWKITDCKEKLTDGSPLGKALMLAWSQDNFPDHKALTVDAPQDLREGASWRGKFSLQDSESDDRMYDYIETANQLVAKTTPVMTGNKPVFGRN